MQSARDVLDSITLKQAMTKDPHFLRENDAFSLVEKMMRNFSIRHLPVVNFNMEVVGIISQRDFYRVTTPHVTLEGDSFYSQDLLDQFIIKNVMTKTPFVLYPESSLFQAMVMMSKRKYGCIPVVDKQYGRLQGIITKSDVFRILTDLIMQQDDRMKKEP